MITSLLARKRLYEFLLYLYTENQEFNKQVINLRNKKVELIKELKLNKERILAYNKELKLNDDNLDWFHDFQIDESTEFPEKMFDLKQEEVDKYIENKSSKDKVAKMLVEEKAHDMNQKGDNNQVIELAYDDRNNKRSNDNPLMKTFNNVQTIKNSYKRNKLVEECKLKIKTFDNEVKDLKSKKIQASFKQKLGEFELLMRHEEYYIIKAFDTDDAQIIKKLDLFCAEFKEILTNLKSTHEDIIQNEEELEKNQKDKENKDNVIKNLNFRTFITLSLAKKIKKPVVSSKISIKQKQKNSITPDKTTNLTTMIIWM